MAYKVKKRGGSQKGQWALVWAEYRDGKQVEQYVREADWPAGLEASMSVDQARQAIAPYNAQEKFRRQEASRARVTKRLKDAGVFESGYLPPELVAQFERRKLRGMEGRQVDNWRSRWNAVRRMIAELALPPEEWEDEEPAIYRYCKRERYSLDYTNRLIRHLNEYGRFYAKRLQKPYGDVAWPRGHWATKISEAYYDSDSKKGKSDKLTIEHLRELKKKLDERHYNWVFVAFWFGLRPQEVDQLRERSEKWSIKNDVLTIYQPKLIRVRRQDRYKHIPATYKEQKRALAIIRSGDLERPPTRTRRVHFPEGVTLYGCRHGFTSLMDQRGHDIAVVSRWLGHVLLSTTEQYYRDRGLVKRDAA